MKRGTRIFDKRIPTILGIVILGAGLIAGVLLVGKPKNILTKAGPSSVAKEVKITNLGQRGLTVSWVTDIAVSGMVKYSEDPLRLNFPASDIRDQATGEGGSYTTHYVEIGNLSPDRTYYFEIVSGSGIYDDNEKPYQVRTLAAGGGNETVGEDIISGKILSSSGQGTADGVIVYVEIDGGETLSALTTDGGKWHLNLADIRDKNGRPIKYDSQNQQISIFAQGGLLGTATALTNSASDTPVGDIILGKNLNLINKSEIKTINTSNNKPLTEGGGFGQLTNQPVTEKANNMGEEEMINPQIDGEKIATSSPEFRGKLPPGTSVQITVDSAQEQKTTVAAGDDGYWKWTPPKQLEAGNHIITIEYWDDQGVLQKIVRSFTVLAAGDEEGLPSFSATPSATPLATPTESLVVEPTIAEQAPVKPTVVEATSSSMPSTKSGVPVSGDLTKTTLLLIVGLGLFFGGQIVKKKWIQTI